MTWLDALDGYWLSKRRDLSANTINDYTLTFRRFGAWVGATPVAKVTPAQINGFLDHLASDLGLGRKTVQNAWTALSSFWSWAAVALDLPHPMAGEKVPRPRARRPMVEPYTEDEVKRLVKACATFRAYNAAHHHHVDAKRPTAARDTAIMVVFVSTGLRVSELCDLQMRDYDRRRGRLTIRHGKGDKMRQIFAGETSQRYLWRYLAERGPVRDDDPLFATQEGRRMDRHAVRQMVERAGQRADVPHAGCHRFRHTFAINFLRNGGNLLELQEMLGHERLDTIRIYARLASVDLERAARRANVADVWRL